MNEKKDLVFVSSGDSKLNSYYFNPKRRIPNPLQRNSVLATVSFLNNITAMFPESKCLLNWVSGKLNSADLVLKFFKTPVLEAGGDFYRH